LPLLHHLHDALALASLSFLLAVLLLLLFLVLLPFLALALGFSRRDSLDLERRDSLLQFQPELSILRLVLRVLRNG
jgi:hypothetical protein